MQRFLAKGYAATSWLAFETSDVPYILKLACGYWTSFVAGDTIRQLDSETDQLQLSLGLFPLGVLILTAQPLPLLSFENCF